MNRSVKTYAALGLVGAMSVAGLVMAAQAQTVPAKPGLWASASKVELNGRAMPTLFDINGIPDAKKAQMRQSMAAAGLPAGWNPFLTCETATQVDLQEVLDKMKAQGCTAAITSQTGSRVTASLQCTNVSGNGAGTVEVTGIGTTTVNYVANLSGVMLGQPMTYKGSTVSRFLGSSCTDLPPGVDASMVTQH